MQVPGGEGGSIIDQQNRVGRLLALPGSHEYWLAKKDLNLHMTRGQSPPPLPFGHSPLVEKTGFEPVTLTLPESCSPTELQPLMVGTTGFEPATASPPDLCSIQAELRSVGRTRATRTLDPRAPNAVLYPN